MGMSIGPHWLEEDWDASLGWPPDSQIAGTVFDDGCGYIEFQTANPEYRADLSDLQGQVYDDISELDAAIRQRLTSQGAHQMNVTKLPRPKNDNCHDPRRSTQGQGQQCFIHVIGRSDEYADGLVGSYGQISAGCGPTLGEDFSETIWPVVIKVKPHVIEGDLIQHLRDLADSLEKRAKPKNMQRTLAEGWQHREKVISESEVVSAAARAGDWSLPIDPDPITGINFAPSGGNMVNIETRRSAPASIAENGFHVKDGWLYSGNQKVPSFTPARATLSGDTGYFVAMTDEGQAIFAWHDHDRSTCNCQHINIETYLPSEIPPIELAPH